MGVGGTGYAVCDYHGEIALERPSYGFTRVLVVGYGARGHSLLLGKYVRARGNRI